MTALSSAWLAWDRAVALGSDASAADWLAVADAWRAAGGRAAEMRVRDAMRRAVVAECPCAACVDIRGAGNLPPISWRGWESYAAAVEESIRCYCERAYTIARWPIVVAARAHADSL